MFKRSLLGAGIIVLALAGVGEAQTSPPGGGRPGTVAGRPPTILFTPPLSLGATVWLDEAGGPVPVGLPTIAFACGLANVSANALTVRTQVIDAQGQIKVDSGNMTLAAGAVHESSTQDDGTYYCKFTVQGDRESVRGAAKIREQSGWSVRPGPPTIVTDRDIVAVPAS